MMLKVAAILLTQTVLVFCLEPIIKTQYGNVKGKVQEFNGNEFTSFFGVPYAAPPVGTLRFKPPQPHAGWGDTVLDALEWGNICPQVDFNVSFPLFPKRLIDPELAVEDEDCLTLDIYIAGDVSGVAHDSMPVLVFIHGGGFVMGASPFEQGNVLVTQGDPLVVVSMQYRLGPFGFLTSGDDALPGNLGFKDQTFALQWVQDNIAAFGGDPNQVTISGESAGGESILAHMISPMSAGLFHRASSQSAPLAWVYKDKSEFAGLFKGFAKALDCEGESEPVIKCLQQKTWQEIHNVTDVPMLALIQRVIDGQFITDEPENLWAAGKYNPVEHFMVGVTSDEGSVFVETFYLKDFLTNRSMDSQMIAQFPQLIIPALVAGEYFPMGGNTTHLGKTLTNAKDLHTMIKAKYYDAGRTPIEKGRLLLDMAGDAYFLTFSLFAANQVADRGGNVHVYVFDHRVDAYPQPGPDGMKAGAPHGSELPFQFGYGFTDPDEAVMTSEELSLSRSMIHAWTSFAAGKPSFLDMEGEAIEWPQYSSEQRQMLWFDTTMSQDSVIDGAEDTQPILDFWIAIKNLAVFEETEVADKEETTKDEL